MKEFREKLNIGKARLSVFETNLEEARERSENLLASMENHKTARSLFQRAAEITQGKLAIHLSDLVSLALRTVFDDPYKFIVKFVSKRGSTECQLLFTDNQGNEFQPLNSCGYGAADVASLALRVSYHSLGNSRPVIILDEPLKYLSVDLMDKASELIKSLSKELGLQFIIVTHSSGLSECADKTFRVTQKNGISQISSSSDKKRV